MEERHEDKAEASKNTHRARKIENKRVIEERKKTKVHRPLINMVSKADMVKGQGVLAVYEEVVKLVREYLKDDFDVVVNADVKADIVHYHTINPEFLVAMPTKKLEGSITLGFVHFLPETVEDSIDMPDMFRDIFDFYLIHFYKAMDYLVVVNPYFIDLLVGYGIERENIFYVPNFVSEEDFYPLPEEEVREKKSAYGLDPDKFTVLGVGQLQTRKGVMDFVKIAKAMPDVQFVWAGGFSFSVISEGYKEIKEVTEDPPANLKFLGIVEREEMNGIYNLGDVMFLPSYAELFPMSILEAMSCHKPILLRDLDIYPDILFDFYLKADDNEGFINEITRLRDDGDYRASATAKAIKGSAYYNRANVAKMWKDLYGKLLREGNAMRKTKKDQKRHKLSK